MKYVVFMIMLFRRTARHVVKSIKDMKACQIK